MASAREVIIKGVELISGDSMIELDGLDENSVDAVVCDPPYHLTINARYSKGDARTEASLQAVGTQGVSPYMRTARGFLNTHWDAAGAHAIAFDPVFWTKVMRVLKPGGHLLAFTATKSTGDLSSALKLAGFEARDTILSIIDGDERVHQFVASLDDAQRCAFLQLVVENSDLGGLLAWVFGSGFQKGKPLDRHIDRKLLADVCDAEELARGPVSHTAAFYETRDIALKPAFEPIVMVRKPLDGTNAENLIKWGTGSLDMVGCAIETNDGALPSNVIHDGSPAATFALPPGTSKFFYCPKAADEDRVGSDHPSVKPTGVMQYLVRLVTTPGQLVLDPFAGTGSTGLAAAREGRRAILIEREPKYQDDIRRKLASAFAGPDERRRAIIRAKSVEAPFEAGSLFASLNSAGGAT